MQVQEHTAWKYSWHQRIGERPTEQNAEVFHRYVEDAYTCLEEDNPLEPAMYVYSEVRKLCHPAYFFQVVSEMRSEKLSMRVYTNEEGLKLIAIHKVS
jgi:hypothetical protein